MAGLSSAVLETLLTEMVTAHSALVADPLQKVIANGKEYEWQDRHALWRDIMALDSRLKSSTKSMVNVARFGKPR